VIHDSSLASEGVSARAAAGGIMTVTESSTGGTTGRTQYPLIDH